LALRTRAVPQRLALRGAMARALGEAREAAESEDIAAQFEQTETHLL
jgi:hypothetical protein